MEYGEVTSTGCTSNDIMFQMITTIRAPALLSTITFKLCLATSTCVPSQPSVFCLSVNFSFSPVNLVSMLGTFRLSGAWGL